MQTQYRETSPDLATWNRARSNDELRSFVKTHLDALASVEI
jgi:hypothetical protein